MVIPPYMIKSDQEPVIVNLNDRSGCEHCANKDAAIKELVEALEDCARVLEWGEPKPKPVLKRVEKLLAEHKTLSG